MEGILAGAIIGDIAGRGLVSLLVRPLLARVSVLWLELRFFLGTRLMKSSCFSFLCPTVAAERAVDCVTRRGAFYDLCGNRLSELTHGINIVRYSDGTTRKVMVK